MQTFNKIEYIKNKTLFSINSKSIFRNKILQILINK